MSAPTTGRKIGAKRQAVLDRVRSAFAGSDGWVWPGNGFTVRWAREQATPDWARERYRGLRPYWDQPTYTQHVFVTLVGSAGSFVVLLRVCRAPWVVARDTEVTLARALAVLEDPASAL